MLDRVLPIYETARIEEQFVAADPALVYAAALSSEFVESVRLEDLGSQGEWVLLGNDPPHEVLFGAVGRPWMEPASWERIAASEFAGFEHPGFAKFACRLSVEGYNDGSNVTYEARTHVTAARTRSDAPDWGPGLPGAASAMRSWLAAIERRAVAASRDESCREA